MQAQQKCGLKAYNGRKGGTREHPSECYNEEWDTLRSCALNGHAHTVTIVRPQVHMKCSI